MPAFIKITKEKTICKIIGIKIEIEAERTEVD